MSNRYQTQGVILKRVDYGEADRIITFFTPDMGKVTAIAKGVRKPKSKLAGGIELFSICDIGLIKGKRDIDTLISTRLKIHFENMVKDYDRLQIAYEFLKLFNKLTDDDAGEEYYKLLVEGMELIDNPNINDEVVACWIYMQAMKLNGSLPNLLRDIHGNKLEESGVYAFSSEDGGLFLADSGVFGSEDIKAWRVFVSADAAKLRRVTGLEDAAHKSAEVLKRFAEYQV